MDEFIIMSEDIIKECTGDKIVGTYGNKSYESMKSFIANEHANREGMIIPPPHPYKFVKNAILDDKYRK